jgi:hypothetical protein
LYLSFYNEFRRVLLVECGAFQSADTVDNNTTVLRMEEIDRLAARVTAVGCLGALAGVSIGLFKGHHRIARTAGLTAFSCALCGTACLGSERLAANAGKFLLGDSIKSDYRWPATFLSHAIGGGAGGAFVGGLYMGRPTRGVVFFVPLMTLFGLGELLFEDMREERLRQIIQEEETDKAQH